MPTPSAKRPLADADDSSQSSGRTVSNGGGGIAAAAAAAGTSRPPPRASPYKQQRRLTAAAGEEGAAAASFPDAAAAGEEQQQQQLAPPAVALETTTTAAPPAAATAAAVGLLMPLSPERRLLPRWTSAAAASPPQALHGAAVVATTTSAIAPPAAPPAPAPAPDPAPVPAPQPQPPRQRAGNSSSQQSLVPLPPAPGSFADPRDPTGSTLLVPASPAEARRQPFLMRLGPGDAEALASLAAAVEAAAPRRRPFVTRALATPLAMGVCPSAVWGAARPALALFVPAKTEVKIASDDTKVAFLSLLALSAGFADVTAGGIALAQARDPDLLRIRKGDLSIFLPSICASGAVAASAYRAASLAAAVAVAGGGGKSGSGGSGSAGSGGSGTRTSPSRATHLSPRRSAAAAGGTSAAAASSSSSTSSPAGAAATAAALAFAGTPLVLSREAGVKFNGTQPDRYAHWLFSAAMGVIHGVSSADAAAVVLGGQTPSPSSPSARKGGGGAAAVASSARRQQPQQLKQVREAAAAVAAALSQACGANAFLLPPHLLPPPALPSPDGGAPRILHAALDLLSPVPHERAVVEAVVSYMHTILLRHWEKHRNRAAGAPGSSSSPPPDADAAAATSSAAAAAAAGVSHWGRKATSTAPAAAAGYPLLVAAPRSVFFDGADAAAGITRVLPGPSTTAGWPLSSSSDDELLLAAEEEGGSGGAVALSPSRRSQRHAAAFAAHSSPPSPPPLYPPHLSLLALAVAPNARFLADNLDSNRKQGAIFFAAAANGPSGGSAKDTAARATALGLPALAPKNVRRNAKEQGETPGGFVRVTLPEGKRELLVMCRILEGAEEVPAARAALEARLQIAAARRRAAGMVPPAPAGE